MTSAFTRLLAPGRIGPMTLRNRIVLAPMGDRLAHDDGTVSERQTTYLEARARGGAGLIMVGSVSVAYPSGSYAPSQTAISEDRFVEGLSRLTDRMHRHGASIAAQLVHDGANSLLDIAEGRPMLVPSIPPRLRPDRLSAMVTSDELNAMTRPFTSTTAAVGYRVADDDDLAWLVERFVAAAARARAAGFDGVEIHAGHGYLIDSFLSPAANHRDDRWGGSLTNRARLLVEVIAAVRSEVGDGLAVWCRLNAVERFKPDGETPDDLVAVATMAVEAGADAISVSAATDPGAALGVTEAHTPHAPALLAPYAAMVSAHVDAPVIAVGRLEPDVAEGLLHDGHADFVAMGRKLLADPDLPAKLAAGRVDDIRPCIYQYRCIGNIFLNEPVACVANPATGHGDASMPVAESSRRVLVVGGGPAGLEAARLLDQRGHQVILAEARARLGGTLVAAGATDSVLAQFLAWQIAQVERGRVELLMATEVDRAMVERLDVEAVVVATGPRWPAPIEPADPAQPLLTPDRLESWLDHNTGATVAVLGGGKAGLSIAGRCARLGHTVTVLESTTVFAPELGPPGRFRLVHETEQLGVRLVGGVTLTHIDEQGVSWHLGDEVTATAADAIFVTTTAPDATLADSLVTTGLSVHVVGDARAAGAIEGAMLDAERVALAID